MAESYLDKDGLLYFLQKIRPDSTPVMDGTAATGTAKRFALQDHVHPTDTTKADKSATVSTVTWDTTNNKLTKTINGTTTDVVTTSTLKTAIGSATTSNEGLMTTTQVTKLDGIATGAEVNQNAFAKVKVGSVTIEADAKQDTLNIADNAGRGIYVEGDATNDKVTINAKLIFGAESSATGLAGKKVSIKHKTSSSATENTYSFYDTDRIDDYLADKVNTSAVGAASGVCPLNSSSQIDTSYYTDTKNTAGSTGSSEKLYIIGAASQGANPQTYSRTNGTVYIGTDGHVYSDSKQVVNLSGSQALTNKTYNGYTLAGACAKGVVTSISADSTDLPTVTAVKNYVATAVTGATAFQGTAPTTFAPTNYKAGYYWVVGTAGTYAGQTCEAGDMIFATADYNTAYSASDFDVIQTNLDITSITNAEIDIIVAS